MEWEDIAVVDPQRQEYAIYPHGGGKVAIGKGLLRGSDKLSGTD